MYCCKVSYFEDIVFSVSFLCSKSLIDYLFLGQCPSSQGQHSRLSMQCPTLVIQCYLYLLPQMRLLSCKDQLFIVLAYIILTSSPVPLFQTVSPIPCSTECPLTLFSVYPNTNLLFNALLKTYLFLEALPNYLHPYHVQC